MSIKQKVIIHSPSSVLDLVQNNEIVYHVSEGLKIGDTGGNNRKEYRQLKKLFDEINDFNGLQLIELKNQVGALIPTNHFTIHEITNNEALAIQNGSWYESENPSSVNRWNYRLTINAGFNILCAAKFTVNGISDATVMGRNRSAGVIGRLYESATLGRRKQSSINLLNGTNNLRIDYTTFQRIAANPTNPALGFRAWGFNL